MAFQVPKFIILLSLHPFLADAQDLSSGVSGKAIYTSSRNPISSYFKEQKSKIRPYFTRPAATESGQYPASFGSELNVHDETSVAALQSSSNSYGNSGGYYDVSGGNDNNVYPSLSASAPALNSKGDQGTYTDPFDPSNFQYEASNAAYTVADPTQSSANPGYYGGDPLHGSYSQPSYHPPGLPASSGSSSGNPGYYGASDSAYAQSSYHENSVYSSPQGGGSATPPQSSSSMPEVAANPEPATSHHHAPPTYTYNHDKNTEAENSDLLFPIAGYPEDEEEVVVTGHGGGDNYDYTAPDDDEMLLEIPKKPLKPMVEGLLGGGGGGGGGDAAAASPAATDAAAQAENPLNFLNLVGTDFQPGRLVNIFFGLFIMLFMIISHGYALWILGIAYLPGTRSLNNWELDKEKIGDVCELVLDAIEYWENRID